MTEQIKKVQAKYLVNQMVLGALNYTEVVEQRPDLKPYIDSYIEEKGLEHIK